MKSFLKKWILLFISILVLMLLLIYWIFKPADDAIGAFFLIFYVGLPLISILTTVWFCIIFKTKYKYFSPLLLIPFDFIWIAIFGDIEAVFKEFFSFFGVFAITTIPAVIVSLICLIVSKIKNRCRKTILK